MMEVLFLLCLCVLFDHQVAACPQGCNCDKKSSVVDVFCSNRNLQTFPFLKTIPIYKTEYLNLQFNNNSITDITLRDEDVIHLPRTPVLDLSYNLLTSIPAYKKSILSAFTRLWNLYLYKNRIHHIHDDAFRGLNGLMSLYLSNNHLTIVVASWFHTLSDLGILNLGNNLISSFEPDNNFSWPDSLDDLYLDDNTITSMPPLPIKDCSKKPMFGCSIRTNLNLEGNNIYSGCRRPEHDKTILNMTLPLMSVRCGGNTFRLCPKFNANSFFQTYVEKPVCEKPRIRITGEPKPEFNIKCVPNRNYQNQENQTGVTKNTVTIKYEAENMFGKAAQIIQLVDDTFCQCHESVFNKSASRERTLCFGRQTQILPLWSMVTFCFFSFIPTFVILVFVIDNCIRSDVVSNENDDDHDDDVSNQTD